MKKPTLEDALPVRMSEYRTALVKELKEFWQDRTSRIVLLSAASVIAAGIAGSAALYSRGSTESKKEADEAVLVKKEAEKPEDPVTREERLAIHRKIIDDSPDSLPNSEKTETKKSDESVQIPPISTNPKTTDADMLREKRDEIANTGKLSFSTDSKNMEASIEALKEWSRQDAGTLKK